MAHHQGLILLSIGNLFFDNIFQKRFMLNPEIEAVDILLEERMPKEAILTKENKEKVEKLKPEDYESYSQKEYTKPEKNLLRSNVIASDNYMVYLDDRGRGFSKYKDILINKFSKTADYDQGIFFYLKNIKTKQTWTTAYLGSNKQERYKITFSSDSNQIEKTEGNIETKTKITVVPNEATEIRRLSIKNNGPLEEMLEVSSFLEPVLSKETQENAHPAFNNLFLKYEWKDNIMLVERRKRGKDEEKVFLAVSFFSEDETIGKLEYEIDKAKLVGRGNISVPEMIAASKPFSRNVALAVESALAFRTTIKIAPDEEKQISLILSVAQDENEAISNVQKYQSSEKIKRAIELRKSKKRSRKRVFRNTRKASRKLSENTRLFNKRKST